VLQRHRNAWPCFSSGAPAHRIDNDHNGGALLVAGLAELSSEHGIHIGGGAKFANAKTGQFLAHRGNEEFRVCHNFTIIS
jgi:hypothetical protein